MTTEIQNAFFVIFKNIWKLFTSFNIPGTNFTPGALLIFILFFGLSLRLISVLVGGSSGSSGDIRNLFGKGDSN